MNTAFNTAEIWVLCCSGVNFATHAPPGGGGYDLTASNQLENKRISSEKMPQPHDAIHHEEVSKDFCSPAKSASSRSFLLRHFSEAS